VFGDDVGLPRLLRLLPPGAVQAAVRAGIRPAQEGPLARLCSAADVPLLVQPRVDAAAYPSFAGAVERLAPDFILVDSYSMLLPAELLAIPTRGALNVHGALLPAYRGANPTQWALLNDERETGVTIHCMTEEFDAGDIVAQSRVPIRFEDTWVDIHARIRQATEALLAEQLPRILEGSYERRPQDAAAASHFRRRRPEDGRIDWGASTLAIYNLIRALVAPNPGAVYRDGDADVVVDRYLTMSEVATLKYARPEVPAASGTMVRLVPLASGGNHSVALTAERLDDASPAGEARLDSIDWDRRRARLVVDADKLAINEISVLARAFAADELGIDLEGACRSLP
jgi:methionyl-tRNA formyltransferase